jgi:alpha,alpha-trehalase
MPVYMKFLMSVLLIVSGIATRAQMPATPDQVYGQLFKDVQMNQVLPDGKTFVDCTPKRSPKDIMYDYGMMKGTGFDLKKFVADNFDLPKAPAQLNYVQQEKDVSSHIKNLWSTLQRNPDSVREGSSLLPLPYPYIVPGGRFREMYYWDTYFTMLGLKESGETTIIENMVDNFAWLINTYGHIPNGTRTYYLSRSQPPFFGLMVSLLASIKGDAVYQKYLPSLEKEYLFFMDGDQDIKPGEAFRRVVKMPDGSIMNRYWDDSPTPRQESYREDVLTADTMVMNVMSTMRFASQEAMETARKKYYAAAYTHLRACAESGIDFSTRWFADVQHLYTIETTDIVPVDLNSLLYEVEKTLAKAYKLAGNNNRQKEYEKWAAERKAAINKYCYDEKAGYYFDYHFVKNRIQTIVTPAGMYPFCFFEGTEMKEKAKKACVLIKNTLLKDGGIASSVHNSGQQWDAPNGWAPLNWMTIWGFDRCGQVAMAKDIATRWARLNNDVYQRTGKLLEKYNVVDTHIASGGGEYPTQDGFGWTNGVLLALIKKYALVLK